MKATWTVAPASPVTLGDDSQKWTMKLEQLGGAAAADTVQMFQAANPKLIPLGNAAGDTVFTAAKSHTTRDAAALFFKAEYARLNQSGLLVMQFDAATLTFAGALLKGLTVSEFNGLWWNLRYTFGTTTIT